MITNEMEEHLQLVFRRFSLRSDIINDFIIDPVFYTFKENISEEDKWIYYNFICKELKIKNKIIRSHGMTSKFASIKKYDGHKGEQFFEQFGFTINKGTKKTDISKNGKLYGSVKSGKKIQWGMHMFNQLNEEYKSLFKDWYQTFEDNNYSKEDRIKFAIEIINKLNDRNVKYNLFNYFLIKNENIPYLLIRNLNINHILYYEIDYNELINVLVDNMNFYHTKDKIKIVASIKINSRKMWKNSNNFVIFEFETRTDKKNAILLHGSNAIIIDVIKEYNIKINKIYE